MNGLVGDVGCLRDQLVAAASGALLGSLYLAFFKEAGYGDAGVGLLRSVGGIGVVGVASPFGAIVARLGAQRVAVAGFAITGAVTALCPFDARLLISPSTRRRSATTFSSSSIVPLANASASAANAAH